MPDDPPGFEAEMRASGQFEGIEQRQFAWDHRFTAATLTGMLGTHSEHRALPRRRRSALLGEIRAFVETDLGGAIVDRYVTSVCVGHVASWCAGGGMTSTGAP